jgi:hypothetical protein
LSLNFGRIFKNEEAVLLLTGAINVLQQMVPTPVISNSEERLSQYLYSIGYAIDHYYSIEKIVFCENTDYAHNYVSLIERARKKGKELEILTFKGNYPVIQQRGKGYGEGEAIEYALKNSKLLKNYRSFYKLTGRLVIENLDQLVASTKEENGFIWHPKEIYQRKTDHVETFFFKASREFYTDRLLDAYKEVDEINHLYIEHLFYERLKKLKIRAFKFPLQIIGNSGTSGKPYLESMNAIRLERICCIAGAHHLHKNAVERILSVLLSWSIQCRTKWRRMP